MEKVPKCSRVSLHFRTEGIVPYGAVSCHAGFMSVSSSSFPHGSRAFGWVICLTELLDSAAEGVSKAFKFPQDL